MRSPTKLAIGASNDPLDLEADRVADRVSAAPGHSPVSGASLHIQRLASRANASAETAPVSVDGVLAGPGSALAPALRQDMERRFGHDFSNVRVHFGTAAEQSAREVSAEAYTVGQHIVFAAGRYEPGTPEGRRLLAHELTHVVQQSGADEMRFGSSGAERSPHAGYAGPANMTFAVRALHQLSAGQPEADEYTGEGVLMTLAGSGTCVNGGAASACDPTIGAYRLQRNNNTCCTQDCSLNHELTHVTDITNWGCCKALSVAYNAPGANKNAAVQKYNTWLSSAVNITECHAYTNDVSCADQKFKAMDCAGAGKNTDCCKDIADYKVRYQAFANATCAAAPKTVPPCPAF
jgi:hypothetical protein